MRRSAIVIIVLIFILFIDYSIASGQKIIVKNRNEFSFAAGYCIPLGPKSVDGQPTILANMEYGFSAQAKYVTSLKTRWLLGATVAYTNFSGWDHEDNLFKGSSLSLISIGPTIGYRTWSYSGVFHNKVNVFGTLTPGLSQMKVKTTSDSEINGGDGTPLQVDAIRFFIRGEAGLSYNIRQAVALFAALSYDYNQADSQVFSDASYSFLSVKLGTTLRLGIDKRYKFLQ